MSLDSVASKALAVRRRGTVSEGLTFQETMGPGMWPDAMMPTAVEGPHYFILVP